MDSGCLRIRNVDNGFENLATSEVWMAVGAMFQADGGRLFHRFLTAGSCPRRCGLRLSTVSKVWAAAVNNGGLFQVLVCLHFKVVGEWLPCRGVDRDCLRFGGADSGCQQWLSALHSVDKGCPLCELHRCGGSLPFKLL